MAAAADAFSLGRYLEQLDRVDATPLQGRVLRVVGLLIESPEPINRPGRFAVGNLTLDMGIAGTGIKFGIRRRDRVGARLLFLTATPFAVATQERVGNGVPLFGRPSRFAFGEGGPLNLGPRRGPFRSVTPRLTLNATSTLDGGSVPVTGSLVIPPQPDFALEP